MRGATEFNPCGEVINWITSSQFFGIHRLSYVVIEADLITALVERWREETHTFHLPFGEVTITLEDVNVLLGLKIGGKPITGRSNYNWFEVVTDLLGIRPANTDLKAGNLKLSWLKDHFQGPPEEEGANLQQRIRAYLLYLFGTVLFPDKSGSTVSVLFIPLLAELNEVDDYSWGSAALACMYRNLCKASETGVDQIAGPLILLQLWSWERIAMGRPEVAMVANYVFPCAEYPLGSQMHVGEDPLGCRWLGIKRSYKDHKLPYGVYRQILDMFTEEQFTWQPYTLNVLECLPDRCREEPEEFLVRCPLICFYMVEYYHPDRCMRQFGWYQTIPQACNTDKALHNIDRRARIEDYADKLSQYVGEWNARKQNPVQPGVPYIGRMSYEDPYLIWYLHHTRRLISPKINALTQANREAHDFRPTYAEVDSMVRLQVSYFTSTNQLLFIYLYTNKIWFHVDISLGTCICLHLQRLIEGAC